MMLADMNFGQALMGGAISTIFTATVLVFVGLILWPRVANSKIRQWMPDDAEDIVDRVSREVREGVSQVTLPENNELRFVWHVQKLRELANGQTEVIDALEAARVGYKAENG